MNCVTCWDRSRLMLSAKRARATKLWAPTLDSMAHVGQIGTFLTPEMAASRHR